jgi:hypothetical protein
MILKPKYLDIGLNQTLTFMSGPVVDPAYFFIVANVCSVVFQYGA